MKTSDLSKLILAGVLGLSLGSVCQVNFVKKFFKSLAFT